MTYHFPKKILGSCNSLTYKRLVKSYDELRRNLTKILRSFENRAPVLDCLLFLFNDDVCTDICVKYIIEGGSKRTF